MPRSMWNGSIGFGLVNVPVELVPAVRDLRYHFREIHEEDGAPVRHVRFCSQDGKRVGWDEIGRGFELEGEMIVLTEEELESVQPEKNQTIEIEAFVDLDQVDPLLFDHPYYLVPEDRGQGTLKAYRLLVEAMKNSGQVAIGRFVMRSREYLTAVHEREGALALSTMRFADEVRSTEDLPAPEAEVSDAAVDDLLAVINERTVEWEPERYEDLYRKRLKKVIEGKRRGKRVSAPEQTDEAELEPAPDLMAALKQTLERSRSGKPGSGSRGGPGRKRKRSTATPGRKPGAGSKQGGARKSKS